MVLTKCGGKGFFHASLSVNQLQPDNVANDKVMKQILTQEKTFKAFPILKQINQFITIVENI
ncbi:MAG: hypothetical protein COB24_07735 [Hyphomicrobiales bacterium]|nr:MAG: hypothetical protein COB24_07735 [Hyphomicrobiales bacterium]